MMPDISHGKMLCKHLREKIKFNTDTLPTYVHSFPDGRNVPAKLYPVEYLGDFRVLLAKHWMVEKAQPYFKARDPAALIALDKMLLISAPSANKPQIKGKPKAA